MTAPALLDAPVCGMTWGWTGVRGTWTTPDAASSMRSTADHGVTWTALSYAALQATPFSTDIPFGAEPTVTDDEMVRDDGQEAHWRALIADVRAVYSGLITYNCDKYQEDHVTWWDAVDVISSSGYDPLGGWDAQLDRIEKVVRAFDKPFVFLEAGCPSRERSPAIPNDWNLPGAPSGQAQLDWYRDMFAACARRPWVGGWFLWDWPARLYDAADAEANDDYCPYGKPAGQFLRETYTRLSGGSIEEQP